MGVDLDSPLDDCHLVEREFEGCLQGGQLHWLVYIYIAIGFGLVYEVGLGAGLYGCFYYEVGVLPDLSFKRL